MPSFTKRRKRPGARGRVGMRRLGDTSITSVASPITFPNTPLTTELYVCPGGSPNADPDTYIWTAVNPNYVYQRAGVTAVRGLQDAVNTAIPASLSIQLKDAPGRYSWGVGTPMRVDLNVGGPSHTRFVGWVGVANPDGDPSGAERFLTVQAFGSLRRIGQGRNKSAKSCLRTYFDTFTTLLGGADVVDDLAAYWSCEEADGATSARSIIDGGYALNAAGVQFAGDSTLIGSLPLPLLNGHSMSASIPPWTPSTLSDPPNVDDLHQVSLMFRASGDCEILRYVNSYGRTFTVTLTAGALVCGEAGAGTLATLSAVNYADSEWHSLSWQQFVAGSNEMLFEAGSATGSADDASASTAEPAGQIRSVIVNYGGSANYLSAGHIAVNREGVTSAGLMMDFALGNVGESTRDRWIRTCTANGIPYGFTDDLVFGFPAGFAQDRTDATLSELAPSMGAQRNGTLIDQLTAIETAERGQMVDGGRTGRLVLILHNERERRPVDLSLTTAYGDMPAQVIPPFRPILDDAQLRNDITVSRTDGGSARDFEPYGPRGVPRVGTFDDGPSVNVWTGDTLAPLNHASYRVMEGTNIEARYKQVTFYLHKNPELIEPWLALQEAISSRVQITNPHPAISLDVVDQTIIGYSEFWNGPQWEVTLTLVAYIYIYQVDGPGNLGRLDSPASTLVDDLDTTTATFDVDSGDDPWSLTSTGYMLGIESEPWEPVTVSSISGAGPIQTFTVVRHPNAVNHLAGAQVRLWRPGTIALVTRFRLGDFT